MSCAAVKKVGGTTIYVSNGKIQKHPLTYEFGIPLLLLIVAAVITSYGLASTRIYHESSYWFVVLIGLIILCFGFFSMFNDWSREGFEVWSTATFRNIKIYSQSPEQDQIAICKAVQELEAEAKEIERKRHDLERLAQGCK